MADNQEKELSSSLGEDEVAFDYIKGPDYRMVYVDGAIGGRIPNGLVHFSLYGERPSIPRRQVHKIDPRSGGLGEEIVSKTINRGSIVREMACDVVMTPHSARILAQHIIRIADEAERTMSENNGPG